MCDLGTRYLSSLAFAGGCCYNRVTAYLQTVPNESLGAEPVLLPSVRPRRMEEPVAGREHLSAYVRAHYCR